MYISTISIGALIAGVTSIPEAAVSESEAEPVAGTEETQAALVIAKRQAPEMPAETNCVIYRYGSFSTTLTVVREYFLFLSPNNTVRLENESFGHHCSQRGNMLKKKDSVDH